MLGKAGRPWRAIRSYADAMMHNMSVSTSIWKCAMNTVAHLRNSTFNREVGLGGGVPLTLPKTASPDATVLRVFG
jgi:hypothetical protein